MGRMTKLVTSGVGVLGLAAKASGWRGLGVTGVAALALWGCAATQDGQDDSVELMEARIKGSIGKMTVTDAEAYRSVGLTKGATWSEAEVRVRRGGDVSRIWLNVPIDLRSATVGTVADQGFGWVETGTAPNEWDYGYHSSLAELVTELRPGSDPSRRRVVFRAESQGGDIVSGAFEIESSSKPSAVGVADALAAQVNDREVEVVHYDSPALSWVVLRENSGENQSAVEHVVEIFGGFGSLLLDGEAGDSGGSESEPDACPKALSGVRLREVRLKESQTTFASTEFYVREIRDEIYELHIDGRLISSRIDEVQSPARSVTVTLVFRMPSR